MRQEIKFALLGSALLLTVLFIITGGSIYPTLYLGPTDAEGMQDLFREDLRSQGWTLRLSLLTAVIPWCMAGLFYYIINSVHFDRWWNWLIVLGISTLLTTWAGLTYLTSRMEAFQIGLSDYYAPMTEAFTGWIALFAFLIFTIASVGMRWWSSNCRHTPFPQ